MKKKVLVVDLDGTLYKINTFHFFIKFILKTSFINFNWLLGFYLGIIVMLRGFRLMPHSKMKFFILKKIQNEDINYIAFVESISKYKRNIPLINNESFALKILSTAAPSCYAAIISKNNTFDICIGTEFPEKNYSHKFENIKEVKKDNVLNYINHLGNYEIDTMITDHLDDLPLMKVATKNFIFNPNNSTKSVLDRNAISYVVVNEE